MTQRRVNYCDENSKMRGILTHSDQGSLDLARRGHRHLEKSGQGPCYWNLHAREE